MKKPYVLATAVAMSLLATSALAETSTMPASSNAKKLMSTPAKSSNEAHSHNSCKCCGPQPDK